MIVAIGLNSVCKQVELSRWVGADTVKGVLFDKMREAMQGDVSKLIDQAPEGRPKPERIIRSEQLRLQAQEAAGDGQPMDEDVEEEEEPVRTTFFGFYTIVSFLLHQNHNLNYLTFSMTSMKG